MQVFSSSFYNYQNSFFIEQITASKYKIRQHENEKELFLTIKNSCFPCLNQVTELSLSHLNLL